ncbi:MAG: hypothetical protein AW07_04640 [Candidatus Accumulibacter sp. SK-11]|nr:MAG: hypothetical protein AW07_04640 [Candidatus Accumulibacter sp. SK-11]
MYQLETKGHRHSQQQADDAGDEHVEEDLRAGGSERLEGRRENRDVGLQRLRFERTLRHPLADRVETALRRFHLARQDADLVALLLQVKHLLPLCLDCRLQLVFLRLADPASRTDGTGDLGRLALQACLELVDLCQRPLVLRMVLAEVARELLQPRFEARDVALELVHQRVRHDLVQRVRAAELLLAGGIGSLRLRLRELRGEFVVLLHLVVQALIGGDDAAFLLEVGKRLLGRLKALALRLHLTVEPDGVLARRLDTQLDRRVDVRVRKGVRHRRREGGFLPGETDVDDVALARRLDIELLLQQLGQPVGDLAFAFGRFKPLLLNRRALTHPQQLDHALRSPIAVDDVDLRRHVARCHHPRQHHADDRVRRLDVDNHRRRCLVLLRQQQTDDQRRENRQAQHRQRRLAPSPENQEELMQCHGYLSVAVVIRRGFPAPG